MTFPSRLARIIAMARSILLSLLELAFTGLISWSLFLAFLTGQAGRKYEMHIVRRWAFATLWLAGARLVVKNSERLKPSEPRIIVANHSSMLDIPTLFATFPGWLVMVAKESLGKSIFLGPFLRHTGHILLNRSNARQAIATLLEAAKRIRKDKLSVAIFPEGTRSPNGKLQGVREGAFQLALTAGIATQPVVILGTFAIMPKGALGPLKKGVVEVCIGVPISASSQVLGDGSRKMLAEQVRAALLALGVPY